MWCSRNQYVGGGTSFKIENDNDKVMSLAESVSESYQKLVFEL